MPELVETAFAKINLALHVRKRRDDGYHELETIFAFANAGDRVTASCADAITLQITGPFEASLSRTDNLVVEVAERMRSHFAISLGAEITLEKHLPVASGIGGGSADAAATARLLNILWGIDAPVEELAALLAPLGADIPACVASRTVFGTGTGTGLRAIDGRDVSGQAVLLVNPMIAVSTRDVFQRWDGIDRGGLQAETLEVAFDARNDLERPARALFPEIGNLLDFLQHLPGARLVRMSGSGATCFAIFESLATRDAARATVATERPEYWQMTSVLR